MDLTDFLILSLACWWVTEAVTGTQLFAPVRRLGTWADGRTPLVRWLFTPARATYCATCFSVWAAALVFVLYLWYQPAAYAFGLAGGGLALFRLLQPRSDDFSQFIEQDHR